MTDEEKIKAAQREKAKAWRQKNKEHYKEYMHNYWLKKYNELHPEDNKK